MKHFLLLFSLLAVAVSTHAQVVYVNAAATGSADGTSWENAYTNLSTAIDSADAGSALWIAAGRYVTPDSSSFFIDRALSLYGGFAGGETSLDAADPTANETILSGDVLGNDPVGRFDSTLMADNNRVLVVIDTAETSQFTVTIDGLTIRDGVVAADHPGSGSIFPFSGGGVLAAGKTMISRVRFHANRANYGSGTAFYFPTADGSTLSEINSTENYLDRGGAHYSNNVDSLSYLSSTFVGGDDTTATGAIEFVFGTGFTVDDCTFDNYLVADNTFGACIATFNVKGIRLLNSSFSNSYADIAGGAVGLSNGNQFDANREVDPEDCVIDNCSFTDVSSGAAAGAIWLQNTSSRIANSEVIRAASPNGGGIYMLTTSADELSYEHELLNNEFNANNALDGGGAALYVTDQVSYRVIGNKFINNDNSGDFGGGGLYIQGVASNDETAVIMDNEFTGNTGGDELGAALRVTSLDTEVRNNTFRNNAANTGTAFVAGTGKRFDFVNNTFVGNGINNNIIMARGGGIAAFLGGGDSPTMLNVDSCTFQSNVVTNDDFISGGSAIYVSGGTPTLPTFRVRNSSFLGNAANDDAAGTIEIVDGITVEILDSDFSSNSTEESGGAINVTRTLLRDDDGELVEPFSYDVTREPTLLVERSLFINNSAANQGGAINLNSASITAKNSIFIGNALSAETGGSGGAIIINGSSVLGAELDNYLINNTFFNNSDGGRPAKDTIPSSTGNAVAVYQPGNTDAETNSLRLTIQNNAFFQSGVDEESLGLEFNTGDANDPVGFGALTVRSLGGNFFSSNQTPQLTIEAVSGTDVVDVTVDVEDIFTDPFGDFSDFPEVDLIFDDGNNPLIDNGTTGELVPALDFFRAERDNMPDIGAIEFGADRPVAVTEPIANSGLSLEFFPNPAVDVVHIINNDPAIQTFTVLVSDMQGRYVGGRQFGSVRNVLNVSALPQGAYNLSLLINGKVYSKQIVKQ
ncbi:T9SS type A sorting domain-containing protein [Lewinella sp. JB7]|uniref:T9SS type A sorting domain-containing protein n=1 Tax=Lewinella sp. JB7 TaxID=2962887 RepID=UPI0020C9A5A6|nr:T9SS type A sorting domain-containing protein [Lewinella sp. JB7]MCP9237078.1 T9SS type A sorting domain-containing protein [Lewinella sp. JB7]